MTEPVTEDPTAGASFQERAIAFAKRRWIPLVAGALVLVFILWVFGTFNSAQRQGVNRETALNVQYLDNQNELSSFISTVKEQLGVADRRADRLEAVLVDAVKGRYEGGSQQPGTGGALFSALAEAYPDIDLSAYDRVQDAIASGREAYKGKQSKLLDMLREYDKWRGSGLLRSRVISAAGFPSSRLRAGQMRGEDALDRMYNIVLAGEAADAYDSGRMEPLDTNPGEK